MMNGTAVQPLLLEDCARIRRRVKLDPRTEVRVSFRMSEAEKQAAIKVALPDSAGYAVNARTSFGRVTTDLPILTTGVTEGTLIGTIGKGGCKLDLVNANGNISIEKE